MYPHRFHFACAVILPLLPTTSAFQSSFPSPTSRSSNAPPINSALVALRSTTTTTTTAVEFEVGVHDLAAELNTQDLNLCHGILHSVGVRELKDLIYLTEEQIDHMGIDNFDRRSILRAREKLNALLTTNAHGDRNRRYHDADRRLLSPAAPIRELSTLRDGAFDRKVLSRFEVEERHDFAMEAICAENEVYRGRLFTVEQCEQLGRMSEHYSYGQIGTIGAGWTDQIYTLTAQHMACKDVPGMIPSTRAVFRQLFQELYALFPGIVPGSITWENDKEPHLVKYNGKAKGTVAHTDNSEYKFITVNALLSAEDDYTGGGTHITVLDDTIRLEQGEMLIHLGDLEHAGAPIKSGVRRLLIAFLACEWRDEELNKPILENARDYDPSL